MHNRVNRLLAGLILGIFALALFAGAEHVHGNAAGGPGRPATDNCALCSLSLAQAAPSDSIPLQGPVRVAGPTIPAPQHDVPAVATPERAPARAPPIACSTAPPGAPRHRSRV